ncbi:MAG TPA: M28 family metallopeptidase [Vicinamibacterales bacterium]|nr:M28 family metallopeptidase [Vicinamibacterales bacterium]
MRMRWLGLCLILAAGCGGREAAAPQASTLPVSSMPAIDPNAILQHIKVLSDDKFQGRTPGSAGENQTVDYLETALKSMGLKPGNPDGSYVQKVPLVGITGAEKSPLAFTRGEQSMTLRWKDDVVAWTKHVAPDASIVGSDVVFCGYGVEAPEYGWDDFKGVDVKGKTIIVLINDPAVPDPNDPSKLDPKIFGGKAMTYYGRWTYKFEEGARKGAAAVLIVHETEPAAYPFSVVQGNLGEKFDVIPPDRNMGRANIEGWITLDSARRLLAMGGQDFDALKKQAITKQFKPVALGVRASMAIKNTLRTIDSHNVVAKLEGSDAALKNEYVVYTGHWDHLGIGLPVNGDDIYNGARDNAAGCAAILEIARGFTKLQPQPKRSILFMLVTAEEQGLLGSQYYSMMPLYPLNKTLAEINIDEPNVYAPSKDLTVIGMGASDLDDYLQEAAEEQGRTLRPDPQTEKGFYYRSDHFNFAKQGVPALYTESGVETAPSSGKPDGYLKSKLDDYEDHLYHQPGDEVKPDWDLRGTAQDAQLLLAVGYRVANAATPPNWKPGNEFRAKRDAIMGK